MTKHILVTGAAGFIGRNLGVALKRREDLAVVSVDIGSPESELERGLATCDTIFHLAGVNRPISVEEFELGNVCALTEMLERLEATGRRPLIVLSSSAQAELDNPYGRSKLRAEAALREYAARTGTPARIFRLPGVFGKWCRPDYNSVVATFCHNIARGLPIQISDPAAEIDLVHVDDVVGAFAGLAGADVEGVGEGEVRPVFRIALGHLAAVLRGFKESRETLQLADLSDPLRRRLYGTYVSYLPPKDFAYRVTAKSDSRGGLAELLKANGHGQIFLSRTRPGVTRGNHYHDLKVEKFIVVEGEAVIRFRHISTGERTEYKVTGTEFRIVDIPPGWTHSIENIGPGDLITLFWSSEVFDPARTDTYAAEVNE